MISRLKQVIFVVVITTLLSTSRMLAGDVEIIAGWEGNDARGYGFVSPVWTIANSKHFALKPRVALSHLYYALPEAGGETNVISPGASASLGLNFRGQKASLTLAPGYEIRKTTRSLSDGRKLDVDEFGSLFQAELFVQPSPLTTLFAIGSYGVANRYTWARAGLKRQLTNRNFSGRSAFSVGAEVTGQGNFESRARQAGALVELAFLRSHSSLQLHAGYGETVYQDGSTAQEPYYGIGLYRHF